jgi:glycosyltransferase involved in cell wall biosynthesis
MRERRGKSRAIMNVVFVHKEYPGHYGHLAHLLAERHGWDCTFVYNRLPTRYEQRGGEQVIGMESLPDGRRDPVLRGVRMLRYDSRGASRETNPFAIHFDISMWHNQAVSEALLARPEIRPDLVVGHAGFGTALFLADLYQCPLVSYCEYFYRARKSELDYRPEFPPSEFDILRSRTLNATTLLNLDAAAGCISPTRWQRGTFPTEYQPRIRTIFDGIDTSFWYRRDALKKIAGRPIPREAKVVTYVSYGFEPTRGFDVFMRVAKRIYRVRDDVIFVVVGSDRMYYGQQLRLSAPTFREHVLAQDEYDLDRFVFTGQVLEDDLARILSRSDLHIYLTVPFVLSWSMMDALACGCTVLASDTAPVREMIRHEENGLLAGFDDVDGLAAQALRVLDDPASYRPLGRAGTRMIREEYSVEMVLPRIKEFYEQVARRSPDAHGDPAKRP